MTSSLRPPARLGPLLWFGLLAALLVAAEHTIVQRADFGLRAALPPAVAFDLLVVLPGLFYFCVVRPYRLPLSTVAAAFGGGLALSHWLLPAAGLPLLAWAGRLAEALEVLTLGYAAVRLRRIGRGYRQARQQSADFVENLHAAVRPVLGRLTVAVATEVAVFRYAVLGGWAAPEIGPGEVAFSSYQKSGFVALLAAFGGLSVLEMAAAHLVVGHWHPRAAWVLTGLSGYSVLWLLAHGQAVRCRPLLVSGTALVVRVGLVWRVAVAKTQLSRVQQITDAPAPAPDLLNAARLLLTPPNLLLTFAAPQVVQGPFGQQRTIRHLAIYVDEPGALTQQLAPPAH
ncbi:MAG: hypothetical protein EOO56_02905 [Hymenobacter sp.]|nr:MAG: hypothetical protein EOO56_02905 [Hymenobacter sp.]